MAALRQQRQGDFRMPVRGHRDGDRVARPAPSSSSVAKARHLCRAAISAARAEDRCHRPRPVGPTSSPHRRAHDAAPATRPRPRHRRILVLNMEISIEIKPPRRKAKGCPHQGSTQSQVPIGRRMRSRPVETNAQSACQTVPPALQMKSVLGGYIDWRIKGRSGASGSISAAAPVEKERLLPWVDAFACKSDGMPEF